MAAVTIATFRYASQNVGSRKWTTVSAGIGLSSMPHRRTCRQSTCSVVGVICGNCSEAGAAPANSSLTICAACRPMSSKLGMRPPTTPVPMKVSNGPYTGAVEAAAIESGGVARIE